MCEITYKNCNGHDTTDARLKRCFFRMNHNIFNCPTCRGQYKRDICENNEIKKIYGKIHSTCQGERFVPYPLSNWPAWCNGLYTIQRSEWRGNRQNMCSLTQPYFTENLTRRYRFIPHKEIIAVTRIIVKKRLARLHTSRKGRQAVTRKRKKDEHCFFELVEIEDLKTVLNDK